MRETRQPNTPYHLFFFFTLTVVTRTTDSVYCRPGSLRYPFGLSDGYPIRFNCSDKTDDAKIGDFVVQEVTNSNIYVKIPPICKREIREIEQLFQENLAPSNIQNVILVQGCNESSSNCLIRSRFVENRLNLSRCKSPVRCLDGATTAFDVMSIGDVVNRSGCKYWFSSITTESRDAKSEISFNLGRFKLDWWIKERCSNTTCSANATCTDVKLPGGEFGHRCTCVEGFRGDAFTVHGGCRSGSVIDFSLQILTEKQKRIIQ